MFLERASTLQNVDIIYFNLTLILYIYSLIGFHADKVGLIGFKDTGYCGKGFLDNLHVECKGSWPQYWECTDKGGGYGIEVTWVFPKVQIYR